MFATVKNAFKTKEIRRKIFFTFLMLIVIRLGSTIPVPGINTAVFREWFMKASNSGTNALGFVNVFTGGSFENMSILALNITPYITSSIIIQLLTIAFPSLEEMQKDGEEGRKKLTQATRLITIGLAVMQSTVMGINFYRQSGFLTIRNPLVVVQIVASLTAGSALMMWLGERITDKGVGNGISIVLVINIISRMPGDVAGLFHQFVLTSDKTVIQAALAAIVIVAIIIAMVVIVVILNGAERRIPVQYAKKLQGRRMHGGNSAEIPLKVNTAGVMPIIFAISLFQTPLMLGQFFNWDGKIWSELSLYLNQGMWFNPAAWKYSLGLIGYVLLLIFFAYFYTSITFNPLEIADNMKKQGGFIPGVRPGKPTSDYLTKILNYIIFIGAIGLTIVGVLPIMFNGLFKADVSFGGTSLIIIVSVILETLKAIESQMLVRNYKGFLDS